ncbi:uncharacterized protein LOC119518592 [Choloepus didactylus]|uniref:uncharacterized protein LOC119518592 n=1 Tax=Choloepus didactylus TaxID=27675 RepID=UPI0018A0B91E|nr:uncharacterized protein LOC119518592 [Choloepus didactylus]
MGGISPLHAPEVGEEEEGTRGCSGGGAAAARPWGGWRCAPLCRRGGWGAAGLGLVRRAAPLLLSGFADPGELSAAQGAGPQSPLGGLGLLWTWPSSARGSCAAPERPAGRKLGRSVNPCTASRLPLVSDREGVPPMSRSLLLESLSLLGAFPSSSPARSQARGILEVRSTCPPPAFASLQLRLLLFLPELLTHLCLRLLAGRAHCWCVPSVCMYP